MDHNLPPSTEFSGSPPSQSAMKAAPVRSPSSLAIISNGCRTNSITEVSRGLQAASLEEHRQVHGLLSWSLSRAVYHGHPKVVRYLIEHESAPVDQLSPLMVSHSPSIEVFQILIDHGWDINQSRPDRGPGLGEPLLHLICGDESLVRWCLNHGAIVEGQHTDPYNCPPLLENVAGRGTVAIFTLLHSRGAQLGARTLHSAAASVAGNSDDPERLSARMAMVEYLVDDLGLDVNALDTEGQMPNHWGTPLCYAAQYPRGGEEAVRFLLDRGADPSIKDCWGISDAFGMAERSKNSRISEILREWRVQNQGG